MPSDSSDIISRLAPDAAPAPAGGTLRLDSAGAAAPGGDLTVTPSVLRGAARVIVGQRPGTEAPEPRSLHSRLGSL